MVACACRASLLPLYYRYSGNPRATMAPLCAVDVKNAAHVDASFTTQISMRRDTEKARGAT